MSTQVNGKQAGQNKRPARGRIEKTGVFRLTTLSLLGAISILLVFFNFSVLPSAPWLKMDFANVPILICSLLFGPVSSLSVLFAASAIQAFFLGNDGIFGFLMHFVASGAMVLAVGLINRLIKKRWGLAVAFIIGTLTMAAVMIPMNYLIMPVYMGMTAKEVTPYLLPAIIPFNLIKAGASCAIASVLYGMLKPLLIKLGLVTQ